MRRPVILVVAAAVVLLLSSSVYTVSEIEQVVVTQFGRPVGDPIRTPGLHLKIPFVQDIHRFDKRWLDFDAQPKEITTKDKKYIWVDTYARWQIADPLKFYQSVGEDATQSAAQSRLDDIVNGETRNAVASFDLIELVRSENRDFQMPEELQGIGSEEASAKITTGREKIAMLVRDKAALITPQYGIALEDVRFRRINYVDTVQEKVFERMISERKRIAERSRSEGQGRAAEILGQKERDVLAATSVGYKQGQIVKGTADAKATLIFSEAYGRDPDFYQFLKSMETLGKGLDDKSWLVLSTDSELLKYLRSAGPP